MSGDVGQPSKAHVSVGVTEDGSGAPRRGVLVLLCLFTMVWIGAMIYGAIQVVDFVRGLI